MTIQTFRNRVWKYYQASGRHDLPWRKTHDPYKILVSEVMLQQTQVERVKDFYAAWITRFPTVKSLAEAPLADVLRLWQGLGYNRRGKMLHDAAKRVVEEYRGHMPTDPARLQTLPGVGPYTARAIAAFASNEDTVFIETNLRTVVVHHFFPEAQTVTDTEILEILTKALPKPKDGVSQSREWYSALMDYGAYLKRSGVRTNARSKGYKKQSTFAGSGREARGAILRELTKKPATKKRLLGILGEDRIEQLEIQIDKLLKENMIQKSASRYSLPS